MQVITAEDFWGPASFFFSFFFLSVCRCVSCFELPRSLLLYLCRAARGSADIPILPHAHTILLKHAVNLKRKRTLFTSKPCFHQPIVLPTWLCHMNVGFSQNSCAYMGKAVAPKWPHVMQRACEWLCELIRALRGLFECKNCQLRGNVLWFFFFSFIALKRWLSH